MVIDVSRRFAAEARRLLPSCSVYLFGSHAKGCARPGSDIDIAVIVPEIEGAAQDPWKFMAAGDQLLMTAAEIDFDIEPHLIEYKWDRSGFLGTVLDTGLRIA